MLGEINHLQITPPPLPSPFCFLHFLSGYYHDTMTFYIYLMKTRLKGTCLFMISLHKYHLKHLSVFKMSTLSELVWADWIWFPEGYGWADLKDNDGKVYPKWQDLWACIPIAFCFMIIRKVFER